MAPNRAKHHTCKNYPVLARQMFFLNEIFLLNTRNPISQRQFLIFYVIAPSRQGEPKQMFLRKRQACKESTLRSTLRKSYFCVRKRRCKKKKCFRQNDETKMVEIPIKQALHNKTCTIVFLKNFVLSKITKETFFFQRKFFHIQHCLNNK